MVEEYSYLLNLRKGNFSMDESILFFLSFCFNFIVAFIIVRFIYYPRKPNKGYIFTFLTFSTVFYFVMSLLTNVELSIGVGFGLFAIFSLLRYRTRTVPIRDMTYLFTIIALPVMNAFLLPNGSWLVALMINGTVILVLYVLESGWGFHYEKSKRITYEKIELTKPQNYEELLADLRERTGLTVKRVKVGQINFKRKTADLKVYYDEPRNGFWDEEEKEDD